MKIINSEEYVIEDFQKSIDDWHIPKIHRDQIYKNSKFNLFKTNFSIKTEERDIQISKPFESIPLLSERSLQKQKEKDFKYIHIGLVQVGFKPLTKEGLNTSILAVLRDIRFINFEDSLLSYVESSLCNGPISFDCYPNLTVSLNDPNILKTLVLQIKTHNYNMLEGSIPVALIFRVHYKVMESAFGSKVLHQSKKGETLLLQTDLSKSNVQIPQPIKWKDITLPKEWILQGAVASTVPNPSVPNNRLHEVTQFDDGSVRLSFARHSISSNIVNDDASNTSTIDLGRISKLPSVIYTTPRYSTSDIPSSSLQTADYSTRIPQPIYTSTSQNHVESNSPPTSPTFSSITENVANELNVLEKEFILNKEFFKNDFYSSHNEEKRLWFFKNFLNERQNIQKEFYDFVSLHKVQIFFFDWFASFYAEQNKISYPFSKSINPITTRNKKKFWDLTDGSTIQADHPPFA